MALDTQFALSYNKQLKQRLESVHDTYKNDVQYESRTR